MLICVGYILGGKRPAKKVLNWVCTELFGRLRAAKAANAGFARDPSIDDVRALSYIIRHTSHSARV